MIDDDTVILIGARVTGKLLLADNLTGPCAECGHQVQFRPHAPKNRILRCMQCAADMIKANDEMITTPKMIEEAMSYFRRKLH